MNKDDIKEFLESLHKNYAAERQVKIITGKEGMDRINYQIQKNNDRDFADFLLKNEHITTEERNRLHDMINATDEDYAVAKSILATISEKHYTTNIKSII